MNITRKQMLAELRRTVVEILHLRAFEVYGRPIEYRPHNQFETFYFHFRPDGTGFVEDLPVAIEFRWSDSPVPSAQLREQPENDLLQIATRLFNTEIGHALADPYVFDVEALGSTIEFVSGSREELVQVATWICHCDLSIYADSSSITLYFGASFDDYKGGFCGIHGACSERSLSLFDLAFDYNPFAGQSWRCRYDGNWRLSNFEKAPATISIQVARPSQHERAEALLGLSDWLIGKVSESERRTLLQITSPTPGKH